MIPANFKGRAKRIDDIDLPLLAKRIGPMVGEDEIHAVLEVESRGHGFDPYGRPLILFEPHIFYALLEGTKRSQAVSAGLAYPNWGSRAYPKDSYPRLISAMAIDETAALKSASWGMTQILGKNYREAGYQSVQQMVEAFCDDEENHVAAMVNFILANNLSRAIINHDWAAFARAYNGPQYRVNRYDERLASAYTKWKGIKDTPVTPATPIPPTTLPAPPSDVTPVSNAGGATPKETSKTGWLYNLFAALMKLFKKG